MRHRHTASTLVIVLLVIFLLAACSGNRNGGSGEEDEVQSGIATGIAATQAAEKATSEANAAVAQAVDAAVTALAAETANTQEPKVTTVVTPTPPPATPEVQATEAVDPTEQPTREPTPTPPALVVIPFILDPDEAAPTPPALVILPGGGSGDGMEGLIVTSPELIFTDDDPDTPVFSRALSLQMLVRILDEGSEDGVGIDSVEIEVVNDDGESVYSKTENSAGYCLFGGGEPACSLVQLEPGAKWPGTNQVIEDRGYSAYFTVVPDDSSIEYGEWQQNFEVRTSAYSSDTSGRGAEIKAELTETERGNTKRTLSDNLVFQIVAADFDKGNRDGAGIDHVVMGVIGPDGKQVYAKREDNAAYCAFGGDSPCPAWDFATNSDRWPDGGRIRKGRHILRAIVVTEGGESRVFDWRIDVE